MPSHGRLDDSPRGVASPGVQISGRTPLPVELNSDLVAGHQPHLPPSLVNGSGADSLYPSDGV
jgi:hypothetical protein